MTTYDPKLVEAMCKRAYEAAMQRINPESASLQTWSVLREAAKEEWRLEMQEALAAIDASRTHIVVPRRCPREVRDVTWNQVLAACLAERRGDDR